MLLLPSMRASVLTWMWEEDSVSAAVASWLLSPASVAIVKDACPTGVGLKSKNTCQWTAVATLSQVFVTPKNLKVGVCRAKRYSSYQWYWILLQTDSRKMRWKNVCVCEITNATVSCFTVFWLPSMYLNLNFFKSTSKLGPVKISLLRDVTQAPFLPVVWVKGKTEWSSKVILGKLFGAMFLLLLKYFE